MRSVLSCVITFTSTTTTTATLFVFFLLCVLFCSHDVNAQTDLPDVQLNTLIDLANAFPVLKGPKYNWTVVNETVCSGSWSKVQCGRSGGTDYIRGIYLGDNSIGPGAIPTSLFNLAELEILSIEAAFTEPFPSSIRLLPLRQLTLIGDGSQSQIPNQTFPDWLTSGAIQNELRILNLGNHNFTLSATGGSRFPSSLRQLSVTRSIIYEEPLATLFGSSIPTDLTDIILDDNWFTGNIPSRLFTLQKLSKLSIKNNRVNGGIPEAIGSLPSLLSLDLSNNQLSEPIPTGLGNLINLIDINLGDNKLTGEIPDLSKLTNLSSIIVANNQLLQGNISGLYALRYNPINNCGIGGTQVVCMPAFFPCCQTPNTTTTTTTTTTTITTTTSVCADSDKYVCQCSSNLTSIASSSTAACSAGVWTINGDAENVGVVTVGLQDSIFVNGSLFNAGNLEIYTSSTDNGEIIVGEAAQLGGALTIIVTELLDNSKNSNNSVVIISASNISGSFGQINVLQTFQGSSCRKTTATPVYGSTSVSVLLNQSKKNSCGGGNKARTIGIAVGASVGGFIIIAAIIILTLVILQKRGKCGRLFWSNSTHHSTDQL